MSFKFNLFPTQPQKSYYPKGQRDSTSNSLFQLRENKKQQANQFQLRKDNGLGVIALPGGYKVSSKKNSNPRLFKKIGSSKTYNDGTGGRLRRLKAKATTKPLPPTPVSHNFGITAETNAGGVNIEPTLIGNYTVFKFTEASTFTIPAAAEGGTIEYLLVGGGGNGGACENATAKAAGGGGGGGSVLIEEILQAENGTYTIVVGAPGGSTVMTLPGPTTKTATGGSAPTNVVNNFSNGGNSGSGGSGGNGVGIGGGQVGGGGGAGYLTNGGNATPAPPPGVGGAGGAGLDIGALGWESSPTFVGAGGGGGVSSGTAGAGGSGVGGDGGTNSVGAAAVANSGSGGGGAGAGIVATRNGGAGGSGVVYIRYLSVF